MENNYVVLEKGDFSNSNNIALQSAKRIKVTGIDRRNMSEMHATVREEKQHFEEPEISNNYQRPIEIEPEVSAPEIEPSKEAESNEPTIGEFSYKNEKEEQIDNDVIDIINRRLEDSYKGQTKRADVISDSVEKTEDTSKVNEDKFMEVLQKECYTNQAKESKNAILVKYNQYKENLRDLEENLKLIVQEYTSFSEREIEIKKKRDIAFETTKKISKLDLEFAVNSNDNDLQDIVNSAAIAFDKNKKIYNDEGRKLIAISQDKESKSKEEKDIRNKIVKASKELQEFRNEQYQKMVYINEVDEEARKTDEKLTEITGIEAKPEPAIADSPLFETNRVPVTSISNPVANNINYGDMNNPFNWVRENSVNPIPEINTTKRVA